MSDGAQPFSHPIRVETVRPRGTEFVLRPDETERAAIARALGLAGLDSLEARYTVSRNGERARLVGEIGAQLNQNCVVTLEPFPVHLEVPVELDFAPPAEDAPSRRGDSGEEIDLELRLNEDDPPEPILDGMIDLGAVTTEFLALSLDPYPRKPGAVFEKEIPGLERENPFAALAKLKRDG